MAKQISQMNVVVTGASSGIGRATALRLAQEGANLVLSARGAEALNSLADECQKYGARVLVHSADITDFEAVQSLAEDAADFFEGSIDVWVNDPGVGAMGPYDEVPMASHHQVIQTNLIGYMNGAHAVLPHFKRQKSGTMININSLGAWLPSPYAASYTASKYGIHGFSEALRGELGAFDDIHVCEIFPGFVNSPGVSHGANYTGVTIKPSIPAIPPERVAQAILDLTKRPQAHKFIGLTSYLARISYTLAPRLTVRALGRFVEYHMKHGPSEKPDSGTLFQSSPADSGVEGEYDYSKQQSLLTYIGVGALAASGLLLAHRFAGPETYRFILQMARRQGWNL